MTTSELIVRTLEIAGGSCPSEGELGLEQVRLADEIKRRYLEYKRLPGYDFSGAAWRARVEVVQEILVGLLREERWPDSADAGLTAPTMPIPVAETGLGSTAGSRNTREAYDQASAPERPGKCRSV